MRPPISVGNSGGTIHAGTPNRFGDSDEFGARYGKQTIVPNQVVSNGELFVSGSNAQDAFVNNVPDKRTAIVVKRCSAFGADCHWLRLRPTTEGFYDTALNEASDV